MYNYSDYDFIDLGTKNGGSIDFALKRLGGKKGLGIDIKEKKMTLPLIYALRKAGWMEKRKIINIIKNQTDKPAKVKEVIEFVKQSGGIEYAKKVMNKFYKESLDLLNTFQDSVYRESLASMVRFTVERDK